MNWQEAEVFKVEFGLGEGQSLTLNILRPAQMHGIGQKNIANYHQSLVPLISSNKNRD